MFRNGLVIFICLTLYSAFGQNVLVSEGTYFEGEPYLVMNPSNSQHLVAAWMGFQLNNKVVIKSAVSQDGGLTWTSPSWQNHISANFTSADVSLGFDPLGNVYMCYIDYDNVNFTAGKVLLRKSIDGGLSWNNPSVVLDVASCPNQVCIDRPWLVIDPIQGSIYVTNMNADQPSMIVPPYHPYISISLDGGQTFQNNLLDANGFLAGSSITQPMASPAISADGRFIAIYPSYLTSQSLLPRLIRVQSSNQGQSFTYDVAYQGQGFGTSNTLVKAGPLLKTNPINSNQMAYFFLTDTFGDTDIAFIETSNNGNSWSAPTRVNQDPIGNGKIQDLVWADYDLNGDLAVCWRDRRNGIGTGYAAGSEIYCSVRKQATNTWMSDFSLSDQIVGHQPVLEDSGNDFMNVILKSDTLNVIWGDVRSGNLKIYFSKRVLQDSTNSITELPGNPHIIYPNPFIDEIHLTKEMNGLDYYILGEEGSSIKNGKVEMEKIDMNELVPGIYQLLVIGEINRYQYTLIKH